MAMCQFCSGQGKIEDEYCEWELNCVKLTPLPAINLTTGETDSDADPPFYAMFLRYLDDEEDRSEHGSFPINFCPVCGRQLNANRKNADIQIRRDKFLRAVERCKND